MSEGSQAGGCGWSRERLTGLFVGLMLGLLLVFMAAILRDRLSAPTDSGLIQLSQPEPVGALGPVGLSWPADRAVPAPAAFSIDGRIEVTARSAQDQLLLVPASPLPAGPHLLRYQPEEGPERQWEFQVRPPEPLYLKEAGGIRSLYRWRQGDPLLLSGDHLVTDYAPTQAGDLVALAAANVEGGTALWLVDRQGQELGMLLDCGTDRCDQLAWSPQGDRLAFSRRAIDEPGQPRLWTVDLEGAAAPLFQESARLGEDPNWSPDGRYLAFYDPAVNGVRLLDIDTVREEVIPNRSGVSGSWSADSQRLYLPLLVFRGEEPETHLYELEVEQRNLQQLLGERDGWRQVGEPALGLAGQWLALAGSRGSAGAGLGLYLVELPEVQLEVVAEDAIYSYGGPSFDALGQQLLFQRFPVGQSQASPDVLLWQVGQTEPTLLIEGAGTADWLQ